MAGKYGSSSVIFLVDGYNFLAAKIRGVLSIKITSITEETDGAGDNYQIFQPVGKQKATITQGQAFFDTTSKSIHDAMATKLGVTPQDTPRIMCVGFMGNTAGAVMYGIAGAFSVAYEAVVEMSKLTKANAEHLLQGLVEDGQLVQPLAVQTANWNTKSLGTQIDFTTDPSQYSIPITGSTKAAACVITTPVPHLLTSGQQVFISGNSLAGPVINGQQIATVLTATTFSVPVNTSASTGTGNDGSFILASTVNGGAGYQQVTDFSGFTGYVGKVRHSADDSVYADLAVFTNVTTQLTPQRVAVAPGTTVNRYLCHDGVVTGSGSVTALSMFART